MFVSNFIQNFDQLKQYGPPRCGVIFTVIVLKKEGVRFIYVNILVLGPITKFESYDFFQLNMNGHKMLLLLSDLITILLINPAVIQNELKDSKICITRMLKLMGIWIFCLDLIPNL